MPARTVFKKKYKQQKLYTERNNITDAYTNYSYIYVYIDIYQFYIKIWYCHLFSFQIHTYYEEDCFSNRVGIAVFWAVCHEKTFCYIFPDTGIITGAMFAINVVAYDVFCTFRTYENNFWCYIIYRKYDYDFSADDSAGYFGKIV